MKRRLYFVSIAILGATLAYGGLYFGLTARTRAIVHSSRPELLWLKTEFHLTDSDFNRICELHEGYQPKCNEMCARITAKNAELRAIDARPDHTTADIERKMAEIADLRSECESNMLAHFVAVSRAMPPEESKRYLAWIKEKTARFDHNNDSGHSM